MKTEQSNTQQHPLSTFKCLFASFAATCCSSFISYPLDNLKSRMQAFQFKSLSQCAKSAYQEEGIKGLYRGVFIQISLATLLRYALFSTYEASKTNLESYFGPLYSSKCFIAGSISGVVISTFVCPLEVVKIQLQLSNVLKKQESVQVKNNNTFSCVESIARTKGLRGFYSGYSLTFLREILGTGVYFWTYETIKAIPNKENQVLGIASRLFGGGFSGIFCWLLIYPIDTIKTNIQKEVLFSDDKRGDGSIINCIKKTYDRGGLRGFYRGMQAVLLRSFPIHAITLFVYESIVDKIDLYTASAEVSTV